MILSVPWAVAPADKGEDNGRKRAATICISKSYVIAATFPLITTSTYSAVVAELKEWETVASPIDALVSVQDWITQTEKNADDAWLAKNYQRQIDKMIAEDQARIERWKNGRGAN